MSKQQAYAAHVQMRRPSMTARIERQRQTVEITCFLRVTLLELTDMALLQAARRSQDLFRRAAERVEKGRWRNSGAVLKQALKAKSVLQDESKPWPERVLEARALLDDIGESGRHVVTYDEVEATLTTPGGTSALVFDGTVVYRVALSGSRMSFTLESAKGSMTVRPEQGKEEVRDLQPGTGAVTYTCEGDTYTEEDGKGFREMATRVR